MRSAILFFATACLAATRYAAGQAPAPALVRQAAQHQLEDYQRHTYGLQYRVHRVDAKDDSIREVIETADGNVSRTLTWRGRVLTAQEEEGEVKRLQSITVADVQRRRNKSESNDKYAIELIRTLPDAMIFVPAPGQPQLSDGPQKQAVFDFTPDPAFHPASQAQSLLVGVAGRIWIDTETQHLTRIDLRVTKNLNLMFGILARVYQGGTVSYQQRQVAPGKYCYTHVSMDVTLRELMLHNAPFKQTITVTDIRFLPVAPTVKQAVATLLSFPPIKP